MFRSNHQDTMIPLRIATPRQELESGGLKPHAEVPGTEKNFRDLSLSIAVDTSGSTYGRTLEVEKDVIQFIVGLANLHDGKQVRVLPWSDLVGGVHYLNKDNRDSLRTLRSSGGTNPAVLYDSPPCLAALRSSDLWFLLTDGEIEDDLTRFFTIRTAELGLHSMSCVVVVFGSTMRGPPASCNISVGIATYALAPDCLFLFHDIDTSTLSILQAKGRFKQFLFRDGVPAKQPQINEYTTWAELPRMSYEDLVRLHLTPKPQVGKEDIILDDDKVLNLQELYAGSADSEVVESLLRNQDNLKSLVMAEQARGRGQQLDHWLMSQQQQQQKLLERPTERVDVYQAAQHAVSSLLKIWQSPGKQEERNRLQAELRAAHDRNRKALRDATSAYSVTVQQATRRSSYVEAARRQSITYSANRSKPRHDRRRSSVASEFGAGWDDAEDDFEATPRRKKGLEVIKSEDNNESAGDIFLPGFKLSAAAGQKRCTGLCMLCETEALLSILLKAEAADARTPDFPRRGSRTPLTFPLAMSGFKETDILSFFVCCDCCAFHLVRNVTSPLQEEIALALPLADLEANREAWLSSLGNIFKGRFSSDDLFQVFIASLDRKVQENQARNAPTTDKTVFDRAALWTIVELSKLAPAEPTLSAAFRRGKMKKVQKHRSLSLVLNNDDFIDPSLLSNREIPMLRYPVSGFAVIIRLLRLRKEIKEKKIQKYILLRLLFELTETMYHRIAAADVDTVKGELTKIFANLEATVKVDGEDKIDTLMQTPVKLLLEHNLIQPDCFWELRGLRNSAAALGDWTEPGIDVFLNEVCESSESFKGPVQCFNALKAKDSMCSIMRIKD